MTRTFYTLGNAIKHKLKQFKAYLLPNNAIDFINRVHTHENGVRNEII